MTQQGEIVRGDATHGQIRTGAREIMKIVSVPYVNSTT